MTVCPECRDLVPECRARAEALRDAATRWEAWVTDPALALSDVPAFLRREAEREEIGDPRLRRAEMVDAFARTSDAHAAYLVRLRAELGAAREEREHLGRALFDVREELRMVRTQASDARAALAELVGAITAPDAFPVETSDPGARLIENPRIAAALRRAGRV